MAKLNNEGALMRMYWIKQIEKLPKREECLTVDSEELKTLAGQKDVDFITISEGYIRRSKRNLGVKVGELTENLRFQAVLYWSLYGSITEEYFLKDESIWDLTDSDTIEWIKKLKVVFGDCVPISQLAVNHVLMNANAI